MPERRRVLSVVATRPNFMKVAPIVAAFARRQDVFEHALVYTGQHYDAQMSSVFIDDLGVGEPAYSLRIGPGSSARQTALVIERLEPVLREVEPDVVLVAGDVTSTLAAALTASKLGIPVGHVEAGLRSFDRTMPEELNRVLTDALADLLFIHSPEARDNLLAEGANASRIHDVGNTMIDCLMAMRERVAALDVPGAHRLDPGGYLLVTLHRPALVDGPLLAEAMTELMRLAEQMPVVFPVHPRTRAALDGRPTGRLRLLEPLAYLQFLGLLTDAAGVLTDSGGIQEETTWLGVPCFTLRANTERPITVSLGTNTLLGLDPARIRQIPRLIASARGRRAGVPAGWDGKAAERIALVLATGRLPEQARA